MSKKNLIQEWNNHKINHLQNVELEYTQYVSKASMRRMKIALLFWEFLRDQVFSQNEKKVYEEFLLEFINDKNQFIALIAKVEYLPTRVWRKCLWRYNIDFLSFESFLRRITSEQKELIGANFTDMMEGKKPRVLTARVVDRIANFLKKINERFGFFEKNEVNENADRYLTKGAWINNLASLSFGFALYPNGDLDDSSANKNGVGNFFNIKNHVNDFIVNQEDGTYWFFYRFTRSYGGFYKWNEVKLSPWICPGFWQTLFTMVWFFVGPFFTVSIFSSGATISSFKGILGIILGLPLSIWLVVIIFIAALMLIVGLAYGIGNLFSDVDKESVKEKTIQILKPVLILIIIGITSIICYGIVLTTLSISEWLTSIYDEILLLFPAVYALLFTGSILYSFGLMIHWCLYKMDIDDTKNGANMIYNDWLAKSTIFNMVIGLITLISYFRVSIWNFIISGFNFVVDNAVLLILSGIIIYLFIYFVNMAFATNDRDFIKSKKRVLVSLILFPIVIIGLIMLNSDIISNQIYSLSILNLVLIGLGLFLFVLIFLVNVDRLFKIEPDMAEKKWLLSKALKDNESFFDFESVKMDYARIYESQIKQNSYLTPDNLYETLDRLREMGWELFRYNVLHRLKFVSMALKIVDNEILEKLKEVTFGTEKKDPLDDTIRSDEEKYIFMTLFLQNLDFDKSISSISEVIKQRQVERDAEYRLKRIKEEKREKLFKVLKYPFKPFVFLGKVIKDLYEFAITTTKKSCPYVAEQKHLS